MKRGRKDDARGGLLLLAVVTGLAFIALRPDTTRKPTRPKVPGDWPETLSTVLPIAAVGAGVAVALLVARRLVIARALRSRSRFALVPSDAFDPSPEAVESFAAQLARTRRAVAGFIDGPASAVRIRIAPGPDGLVGYELEAPQRARSALRAACTVYGDAQPTDPPNATTAQRDPGAGSTTSASGRPAEAGRRSPGERVRVARAELVLARSSAEPLAERGLDPDPLQAIAAAMDGLRADLGEAASVVLDVRPVSPARRRRLRSQMLRASRRATQERPSPAEALRGDVDPRRVGRQPADLVERRAQTRALQGKLGTPKTLLEIQLLLETRSTSKERARGRMQALLSGFDSFAGENHLKVSGTRVLGLWFWGSNVPGRRRRFDRRMASGRFRPARRSVVTASEIAGLLKPPTVHCQAPNVQRSGGLVAPPPPGLPVFVGQPGLIPLGRVGGPDGDRVVGVRMRETVFSYMAGRSRYGKTETAIGQFVHLARTGQGGLFLDPHADAIAEIKTYLTDPKIRERVVEIDLSDLAGRHGQPGWNLFSTVGRPVWEAGERVEAVVDAIAAALGWDERNTRALNLATQSAQAMVELARALPPELAPTIFQIPTLLSNETWRQQVLPHVSPQTRQFFTDRFTRLPTDAITPVTNLIDRLRAARPVAALLGNPVSTFDARRAMDDGMIVLACPGSGGTRDRLMANLLVYEVLHAAKGRAQVPADRRRPFWVFLDELQTYDGPNLPALLEQSAKYGGRAFLYNQNPERLTDATLNAVTTNRSHLATTAVNAKAAGLLAREWGGEPTPATITQLARYTYLASVTLGDRTSKPFLVRGIRARDLHADAYRPDALPELERAIDQTTRRQPVDNVLAGLDDHDERILQALAKRRPGSDGTPPERSDAMGEWDQAPLPDVPTAERGERR